MSGDDDDPYSSRFGSGQQPDHQGDEPPGKNTFDKHGKEAHMGGNITYLDKCLISAGAENGGISDNQDNKNTPIKLAASTMPYSLNIFPRLTREG